MLLTLSEFLRDVQTEDVHLPGGRPVTAALRVHRRREEAACHSATTLHLRGGEMSWGKAGQLCTFVMATVEKIDLIYIAPFVQTSTNTLYVNIFTGNPMPLSLWPSSVIGFA